MWTGGYRWRKYVISCKVMLLYAWSEMIWAKNSIRNMRRRSLYSGKLVIFAVNIRVSRFRRLCELWSSTEYPSTFTCSCVYKGQNDVPVYLSPRKVSTAQFEVMEWLMSNSWCPQVARGEKTLFVDYLILLELSLHVELLWDSTAYYSRVLACMILGISYWNICLCLWLV